MVRRAENGKSSTFDGLARRSRLAAVHTGKIGSLRIVSVSSCKDSIGEVQLNGEIVNDRGAQV